MLLLSWNLPQLSFRSRKRNYLAYLIPVLLNLLIKKVTFKGLSLFHEELVKKQVCEMLASKPAMLYSLLTYFHY